SPAEQQLRFGPRLREPLRLHVGSRSHASGADRQHERPVQLQPRPRATARACRQTPLHVRLQPGWNSAVRLPRHALHAPAPPAPGRPAPPVPPPPRPAGIGLGLHSPASQTGFSWDEARTVFRWEGQFWIFEREYMPNTGGPVMRWNMRREYSPDAAVERKLYYSGADRRYHLLGAREGWMEVGHLVNNTKDLEFRYFDSDG